MALQPHLLLGELRGHEVGSAPVHIFSAHHIHDHPTCHIMHQSGRRGRGDVPHDEHVRDEELDIALIKMLRKHVFPHARVLDLPLLEKLLGTIERGMSCLVPSNAI